MRDKQTEKAREMKSVGTKTKIKWNVSGYAFSTTDWWIELTIQTDDIRNHSQFEICHEFQHARRFRTFCKLHLKITFIMDFCKLRILLTQTMPCLFQFIPQYVHSSRCQSGRIFVWSNTLWNSRKNHYAEMKAGDHPTET